MERCRIGMLVLATSCSTSGGDPRLLSVTPSEAPDHRDTTIVVEAENLGIAVAIDYREHRTEPQESLRVLLDDRELAGVRLIDRGRVEAIVPAGLAPGSYRVTIEDGLGRIATLADAFHVRAATCAERGIEPSRCADLPPELRDDLATTEEDTPAVLDLLANDSTVTGALSLVEVTPPMHGAVVRLPSGAVRYHPDTDFFGDDRFSYTARAANGASAGAAVSISVTAVNDPPLAGDLVLGTLPGEALAILLPAADPDGDALDYRVVTNPEVGMLNRMPGLSASYQPPPPQLFPAGDIHFDYVVNDGSTDSAPASVTIAVRPEWWDASWKSRRGIEIDPVAGSLTSFAVMVQLDPSRIDYSHTNGGNDLRFVADDQSTVLPHEIDSWDPNGTSIVWVHLDQLEPHQHFWMYYDNPSAPDGQQIADVWSPEHRGVWHLGADLFDSTAGANHGTDHDTALVYGAIAGGRSFDGSDWIDLPPDLVSSSRGTISLWMRSPYNGFGYLDHDFAFYGSSSPNGDGVGEEPELHLGFDPEPLGVYVFFFIEGDPSPGGPEDVRIWSSQDFNDGRFHHVVATWDRGADDARIYVDGVLEGQDAHRAYDFVASARVRLGSPSDNIRTFHGGLDELRVLDAPVNDDWVAAEYRSMTDDLLTFLPPGL